MKSIKNIFIIISILVIQACAAFTVSNVRVESIKDTVTSYGKYWTGLFKYDLTADTAVVWAWLELSADSGITWSQSEVHTVGHVGSIAPGTDRTVKWMVDDDHGPNCMLRVRINNSPKYFYRTTTTELDTVNDNPEEFPKPAPEDDVYETLERLVNDIQGIDLNNLSIYNSLLPIYDHKRESLITFIVDTGLGQLEVGMAKGGRQESDGCEFCFFRATYLKAGSMEFAILAKNVQGQTTDTVIAIKNAIGSSMGLSHGNIMVNWDHQHGEGGSWAGDDSCVAILERAKASAVPAKMAFAKIRVGRGYNVRRAGPSHGLTDGPIDDHLVVTAFKDMDDNPIGSWVRFGGHNAGDNGQISLQMESNFGGVCSFFQGGAGTMDVWSNYIANYAGEIGRYSAAVMVSKIMDTLSNAPFVEVNKLGSCWDWAYYNGPGKTLIQAFRVGDINYASYTAENPNEQIIYTRASLDDFDHTVLMGYANGGAEVYYYWGDQASANKENYVRMSQHIVRAVNILKHRLGPPTFE